MTLDEFRAWHPEFRSAADSLVQCHLDEATLEVAADVFGAFTDKAIRLKAAHSIAMTPFGRSARLAADDGTTTYLTEYKTLSGAVSVRMMVV